MTASLAALDWPKLARRARVPLGLAVSLGVLVLATPTAGSLVAGLPWVLAGLAVRGLASGYLSKNRALATSGPYAHTRNPLYLGSALLAIGFAWASRSVPLAITLALIFVAVYAPTVVGEERYLRAKFPEFEAYARAVPRGLPRLTPARLGGEGGFSRALYLKHREYNAILGAVAAYGVLLLRLSFVPG